MRPTAFIISTARGGVVDEDDLISALRTGLIRGAGLDVFTEEPLPPDHPLLGLTNVLVTFMTPPRRFAPRFSRDSSRSPDPQRQRAGR
jgi:lactate dehydrogenase-like 2-hydroxyacid dehydrogenase